MNPGKRRKMQKREFLIKMVEENKKSLESLNGEQTAEPLVEETKIEEVKVEEITEPVVEVKTNKKKKTV